jgi:chromosome segregation ATPase
MTTTAERQTMPSGERLAKIEAQLVNLNVQVNELKCLISNSSKEEKSLLSTINSIQTNCAVRSSNVASIEIKVKEHTDLLDTQDKRIDKIDLELQKLAAPVRVFIWVGAAFGVSIIGLIWSLITGSLVLGVP